MVPKTILIADDETHILNVLAVKLHNAGFAVITAEDGAEAYHLACTERPDLIITDYQMPRLSGMELCAKLSSDPRTRGIPAVMLTARGFAIPDSAMGAGNLRCVIDKPFSPREVVACVCELVHESPTGNLQAAGASAGLWPGRKEEHR